MKQIEDLLFPENGTLQANDEDTFTAQIVDEELDPIDCKFNNDGCVELDTEDYTYLTLSKQNLQLLLRLIRKAEKYYNQ